MATFDEIEPSIKLDDGQSFVGLFDRSKEVVKKETEKFGTRYRFLFLAYDGPFKGRTVTLSGGVRLYDAIGSAIGGNKTPVLLRITAHGAKGTSTSGFTAEIVPMK